MATNDVLIYNSAGLTATITMSSMVTLTTATNNCWQGNTLDFGTPRGELWLAKLTGAFIAAPTAGGSLQLYMSWSDASATLANSNYPGGCTGVDGAYSGPSAIPAEGLAQLEFIGHLSACATGSTIQQIKHIGPFMAPKRVGVPVVAMRTSQVLSSQAASHTLTFLDIRSQIQASA